MFGTYNNQSGFGLIELLIAIAIIGLMVSVGAPAIKYRLPRYQREQFIARLNALVQMGLQQAIISTN